MSPLDLEPPKQLTTNTLTRQRNYIPLVAAAQIGPTW